MPSPLRPLLPRLAALLLLCCAGAAQAQFVWIGPNGSRHYSDQPPPPGTPVAKILKAPGSASAQPLPDSGAAQPPKAPTLAEREADYRKRTKARDEADSKAQAEARRAAARAEQCDSLRENQRMYQSGIRIAALGPDGQKRYLSDAERAAASERTARQVADCR